MNVLLPGETLSHTYTGVQYYAGQLIRHVHSHPNVQLTVMLPHERCGADLPDECDRVICRPPLGAGILGYWAFPPRCLRQYDLIHAPTVRTPFLRRPRGPKLVMTLHDLVPLAVPEYHTRAYRFYFRRVLPSLIRQCDRLIAVSESTRRDAVRFLGVPAEKIQVVYQGCRWAAAREDDLPPPEDYLLAVGTLEPRKNLRRTIEAFLQARRSVPNVADRLLLIGRRGWGDVAVNALLEAHPDQVQWLGYVSDEQLRMLYGKARALIYPSLYEGFGLPVLEAMSLGCPVITSDRTSLPEVGGDAAVYVDPEDVDQIAAAIARLWQDEDHCRELRRRGLARSAEFSWDRCAAQTVAVYEDVLAGLGEQADMCRTLLLTRKTGGLTAPVRQTRGLTAPARQTRRPGA